MADGTHRVYVVDSPNTLIDGVILTDQASLIKAARYLPDRHLILARDQEQTRSLFEAGVHHVVFAKDPPSTARLTVLAAELRLGTRTIC